MGTKIKLVIIFLMGLIISTVIVGPAVTNPLEIKEFYYKGEESIPSEKQWSIPVEFYEGEMQINLSASFPVLVGYVNAKGHEEWIHKNFGSGVVDESLEPLPDGLVPAFFSNEISKFRFVLSEPGNYCLFVSPAFRARPVTTMVQVEMNIIKVVKPPLMTPRTHGLLIVFEAAALLIICVYAIPMRKE